MQEVVRIPLKKIISSPFQPRKKFSESAILHLAHSIKEIGLIQPIVVRKKNGFFELIAGERRVEAARIAGLTDIPAMIKNLNDLEAFQMTLVENMERKNLNPIEIALSIRRLKNEFHLTDKKISDILSISRPQVTNYLRLLKLPDEIKKALIENKITMGHAKSLLSFNNKDAEKKLLKEIIQKKLSVRETEEIAKREKEVSQLEELLIKYFGTKVKISGTRKKGRIEIYYYSEDDLIRIIKQIKI